MSAPPLQPDPRASLLADLLILRRRLIERDTLARVLSVAWLFPVLALLPALFLGSLTRLRPVDVAFLLYPFVIVFTALLSWFRGPSLDAAARRLDQVFGLKQRLATGVELAGHPRPGDLAPIVLTEAAEDARAALRRALPPPPLANSLSATALALLLLASLSFVPPRWLPQLLQSRHDRQLLTRAADILSSAADRLHAVGPDLPGSTTTRIRLELEGLARQAADHTLTPDQLRQTLDPLRGSVSRSGSSDIRDALEKDLRKLDPAELLRKVLAAVRHGDPAAALNEASRVAQAFQAGSITDDQLRELSGALNSVSSETTLPGVAESATNLRNVLNSADLARFRDALTAFTGQLSAVADKVRQDQDLTRTVDNDLANAAALLSGQPLGTPVSASAGRDLMPGQSETPSSGSSSPLPSATGANVEPQTELSRTVFDHAPLLASPDRPPVPPPAYQTYVRRYFQPEK